MPVSSNAASAFAPAQASLLDFDWAAAWRENEGTRVRTDNADYWSKRAKSFPVTGQHSTYARDFLALADVRPGERVLDMGCGTGALATPLARAGHEVVAADFAQGMLDVLRQDLAENAPDARDRVDVKLLSWTDDWDAAGLGENSVDVALSSRSLVTPDIARSLEKLCRVARRRVCVTLPTELSPRLDGNLLREIGLKNRVDGSLQYALLILFGMGRLPELTYITNTRVDAYASPEEAFEHLSAMLPEEPNEDVTAADLVRARENLRDWVGDNLVENPHAGEPDDRGRPQGGYTLARPRLIRWAFLSWEEVR